MDKEIGAEDGCPESGSELVCYWDVVKEGALSNASIVNVASLSVFVIGSIGAENFVAGAEQILSSYRFRWVWEASESEQMALPMAADSEGNSAAAT